MKLLLLGAGLAFGAEQPQTMNVDGRFFLSGTTNPLLDSTLTAKFQILNPAKTCVLYEEERTLDTQASNGFFSVKVGSIPRAAPGDPSVRTASDPNYAMARVFNNFMNTFPAVAGCAGGYTPTDGDLRHLRIVITPTTTGVDETLAPDIALGSVPAAQVAESLQGYKADQFLRLGTGDLTQTNLQNIFATGNYTKLNSMLGVDFTRYVVKDATNGTIQLPTASSPASPQNGQVWYDGGVLKYWNGSEQTLGTAAGTYVSKTGDTMTGALEIAHTSASSLTVTRGGDTPGVIVLRSSAGTVASPTATGSDVQLGAIGGIGYTGAAYTAAPTGAMRFLSTQPYSATDQGSALTFETTPNGSTAASRAERMRIDQTGFVGVGTTTPASLLTVAGVTNPTISIQDTDRNATGEYWYLQNSATGLRIGQTTSADGSYSSFADRMSIDTSGNVGIGTTAPSAKLVISENTAALPSPLAGTALQIGGADSANARIELSTYGTGSTGGPIFTFRTSGGTAASPTSVSSGDILGQISYTGRASTAFTGAVAGIRGTATENWTDTAYGTNLIFFTTSNTTTTSEERMRIDHNGRIGIGTTIPTALLELKAGTANAGTAPLKFTAGTNLTTPEDGAVEFNGTNYFVTSGGTRRTIATTTGSGTIGNIDTIQNSGGSITMTTMAGNSVIVNQTTASTGTTSGALIVNGGAGIAGLLNVGGGINSMATVAATGGANQNSPPFYLSATYWTGAASAIDQWSITNVMGAGANPTSTLTFDRVTGTSGAKSYAFMNGNVGIGTTTPGYRIDVLPPSAANQKIARFGVAGSSNGFYVEQKADQSIQHIFEHGNVGIGTVSPLNPLQVRVMAGQNLGVRESIVGSGGVRLHSYNDAGNALVPLELAASYFNFAQGNIGIGTTTPGSALDISSGGMNVRSGYGNIAIGLSIGAGGVSPDNSSISWGDNTGWKLNFGTSVAGTFAPRVTFIDSGNVGIGTTSPNRKLQLHNAAADSYMQITSNTSGAADSDGFFLGSAGDGSAYLINRENTGMYFLTNNTTRVVVDPVGNVGIGTTAPGSLLNISTNSGGQFWFDDYGATATGFIFRRARGTDVSPTAVQAGDSLGALGGKGYGATGANFSAASSALLNFAAAENMTDSARGTYITLETTPNGSTSRSERMRIDSTGNVGIGTSAPGSKLDVNGNRVTVHNRSSGEARFHIYNASAAAEWLIGQKTGALDDFTISKSVSSVESDFLTIKTTGNIGIGTTNPTYKVHVNGEDESSNMVVQNSSSTTTRYPQLMALNYAGATNGYPAVSVVNSRGSASSPSNVTIGQVIGALNFTGRGTSTFVNGSSIVATAAENFSDSASGSDLVLYTTPLGSTALQPRMTIFRDGKVGIGTTTPTVLLEVASSAPQIRLTNSGKLESDATLTSYISGHDSASAQVWWIGDGGSDKEVTLYAKPSYDLGFYAGGSKAITVLGSNGNVGIGTTNPGYMLHVNGSVAGTGAYNALSDRKYKKDIQPLQGSLAKILELNGVSYNWKRSEYPEKNFSPGMDIGLIAQDVEKVFPEVISYDAEQNERSIAYSKLISPLIEATKELYGICKASESQLRVEIHRLKEKDREKDLKIQELESRLQEIERRLGAQDQ